MRTLSTLTLEITIVCTLHCGYCFLQCIMVAFRLRKSKKLVLIKRMEKVLNFAYNDVYGLCPLFIIDERAHSKSS